ncbi:helix-turn-helix domain-containing protein [Virgibacillus senegalensis]|uniref:helix-turn-helix domain-containing protein n=1 Tax=Virgibacillus senegalensis TaxID=1499679 RepID=UPI00069FEC8F|nr:helix-turn-helix transcriptional regulator [Virgibacillus senegalensis]
MYSNGELIKFHRLHKNMTQNELADAIISISYLSKIENNQVQPSEEVMHLLLKKLGVTNTEDKEKEENYFTLLQEWYIAIINKNDQTMTEIKRRVKEIENKNSPFIVLQNLITCRYLIYLNDISKAQELVTDTEKYTESFTPHMTFYYYIVNGLIHYHRTRYVEADLYFTEAFKIQEENPFTSAEIRYDLYYLLSLNASVLHECNKSIYFANEALYYFREIYYTKRCAECHVLLNINYSRIKLEEKASEHYDKALYIAEQQNDHSLKAMLLHNKGVFVGKKNQLEESIKLLVQSLRLRTSTEPLKKLETIHLIVLGLYKMEKWKECSTYLEQGKAVLKEYYREDFDLHFNVFSKRINSSTAEAIAYLEKIVIPYFESMNILYFVVRYREMLADLYKSQNQHKGTANNLFEILKLIKENPSLEGGLK